MGIHCKICSKGRGGGREGWGRGTLAREHARKLTDEITKDRAPHCSGFLLLCCREPAGRKERPWLGFNLDCKDLNLDQTSRKTLGSH